MCKIAQVIFFVGQNMLLKWMHSFVRNFSYFFFIYFFRIFNCCACCLNAEFEEKLRPWMITRTLIVYILRTNEEIYERMTFTVTVNNTLFRFILSLSPPFSSFSLRFIPFLSVYFNTVYGFDGIKPHLAPDYQFRKIIRILHSSDAHTANAYRIPYCHVSIFGLLLQQQNVSSIVHTSMYIDWVDFAFIRTTDTDITTQREKRILFENRQFMR